MSDRLPQDLQGWLTYIEAQHPQSIELGLDRVARVSGVLRLQPKVPVITVGGTNGKGSICALLEAMLAAQGYRVGLYTSPHLQRYNERVRIAGREADDADLAAAFARVEAARRDGAAGTRLTYFEFGTLAAVELFLRRDVDLLVLEVGLGGRLDAVNVFDADCAVIGSVGMDHMDYLGETRAEIAYEKAGIFRAGRPAVIAEPAPPETMLEHASKIGARPLLIGRDFGYDRDGATWNFWGPGGHRYRLPVPALSGAIQVRNASAALAALDAVADLPLTFAAIERGLASVRLHGRFERVSGRPELILDVAHNPQAAEVLALNLGSLGEGARTLGVFGMLRDKDVAAVANILAPHIDSWFVCTLPPPRGATAADLARVLERAGATEVRSFENPALAYAAACSAADENDRIAAFGSFYTVADVMAARARG